MLVCSALAGPQALRPALAVILHVPRDWVNHVVALIAVGTLAVETLRGPEEFDYGKRKGFTLTPTATASGLGRRCGGTLTNGAAISIPPEF